MNPKTLDIAKEELFTPREELVQRYDPARVDRLIRLRDLYVAMLDTPERRDRDLVDSHRETHHVSVRQAYEDLRVVKQLLPALSETSRQYHRHRFNEMILEVYRMAKEDLDLHTMERAAADYAKFNKIDHDDKEEAPYTEIVVQPFTPTLDPTVLGIQPIQNLDEKKRKLLKQLGEYNPDIEDIQAEEADI